MTTSRMVRTVHATAIFLAVSVGAVGMTTAEAGSADCYRKNQSSSPIKGVNGTLHVSSAKGAVEIVEKLLNAGANPNAVNTRGYTPLHVAALAGHTAIVEALLNAGADLGSVPKESSESGYAMRDCAGTTPLHFAARAGHTDIVDVLLAAGADANAAAANGTTPMYWADRQGHVDVVISLLNAGATHQ